MTELQQSCETMGFAIGYSSVEGFYFARWIGVVQRCFTKRIARVGCVACFVPRALCRVLSMANSSSRAWCHLLGAMHFGLRAFHHMFCAGRCCVACFCHVIVAEYFVRVLCRTFSSKYSNPTLTMHCVWCRVVLATFWAASSSSHASRFVIYGAVLACWAQWT